MFSQISEFGSVSHGNAVAGLIIFRAYQGAFYHVQVRLSQDGADVLNSFQNTFSDSLRQNYAGGTVYQLSFAGAQLFNFCTAQEFFEGTNFCFFGAFLFGFLHGFEAASFFSSLQSGINRCNFSFQTFKLFHFFSGKSAFFSFGSTEQLGHLVYNVVTFFDKSLKIH